MSKFKVGDKVRFASKPYSRFNQPKPFTVKRICGNNDEVLEIDPPAMIKEDWPATLWFDYLFEPYVTRWQRLKRWLKGAIDEVQ